MKAILYKMLKMYNIVSRLHLLNNPPFETDRACTKTQLPLSSVLCRAYKDTEKSFSSSIVSKRHKEIYFLLGNPVKRELWKMVIAMRYE